MSLPQLGSSSGPTRHDLHLVATHVVARHRHAATGRFGLRATPSGFASVEVGDDLERVRVARDHLVVESGRASGSSSRLVPIDGASLAELASIARVDLSAGFSVGADTPALPDPSRPLRVDARAAAALAEWFRFSATVLDRVVASAPVDATPSMAQLWPEHFDLALDLAASPGVRVNIGGSPGDDSHPEPYLYVGPWSADRPGDAGYWNAPFGALLGYSRLAHAGDPEQLGLDFIATALAHLRG